MLDAFVQENRAEIIARAKVRVASRQCPTPEATELTKGLPIFLEQLCDALRRAKSTDAVDHEQIGETAGRHGLALFRMGLSIGQVVHDYGDICQTITELVVEQNAVVSAEEFRTLNLCLDDAIAEAVTEYARQRERAIADLGTERLGILAHELRGSLNTAMLSFESIKSGRVAAGGSTGVVHARSLNALRELIDRSLVDVRLDSGKERHDCISVADLIGELETAASIQAQARGLRFTLASVDATVTVEGDRQILAATVSNLLQNAFKFTRKHSNVSLTVVATADRVLFEVEDECGGLPEGRAEDLFLPFQQRGSDRSGLGLGLAICLKAAKVSGGDLRVRNLPGAGCVFTLDLPRKRTPSSSS
jgi:signal transduction histidine kinase